MKHTPYIIIIAHAWTVPYAELPSNERKWERKQIRVICAQLRIWSSDPTTLEETGKLRERWKQ